MPHPPLRKAQQQFIDDEMLRVPLLAEQVFEAALENLRGGRRSFGPRDRFESNELVRLLDEHRSAMVRRFASSVGEQARRMDTMGQPSGAVPAARQRQELSLLDEEEVAADVAISHLIEAIKGHAEHELREIATYAAALAGDMDMGRDHNPFRPETYARALWEAVRVLPAPRALQVRLMEAASEPLAQLLRQAYAGACARLEASGVEPAAYRTLILPAGTRTMRPSDSWMGRGPDLAQMRDTMPAPLTEPGFTASSELPLDQVIGEVEQVLRGLRIDAPNTERARLMSAQRSRMVRHAETAVDQQSIELLSRLFDVILADQRLARDLQFTLTRLQTTLIRVALHDATLLEDYTHPMWRFMDHVAHQASMCPPGTAERREGLRLADGLIDALAADREASRDRFVWARDRLRALDRRRLERRLDKLAPDLAVMQALEEKLALRTEPLPTGTGPLDESQLETVPAELMDELASPSGEAPLDDDWMQSLTPGDWVRLFLHGSWVRAQLLWQSRRGEIWLFSDGDAGGVTGLRRAALARLYREGLAKRVRPRSLVRSAAQQLMREVDEAATTGS